MPVRRRVGLVVQEAVVRLESGLTLVPTHFRNQDRITILGGHRLGAVKSQ